MGTNKMRDSIERGLADSAAGRVYTYDVDAQSEVIEYPEGELSEQPPMMATDAWARLYEAEDEFRYWTWMAGLRKPDPVLGPKAQTELDAATVELTSARDAVRAPVWKEGYMARHGDDLVMGEVSDNPYERN